MTKSEEQDFQVLALTGGGYRGLYTAHVLERLEEAAGKPIGQCFDLIAGTSIGGILALAVAFEVPMANAVKQFRSRGEAIFKKDGVTAFWTRAKYRQEALRETIESILPAGATISQAKHALIVPTVNLTHGKPQVFKTRHHKDFVRDYKYRAVDVALATSAAPTFFPVAEMENQLFTDGGLFANAPDLLALHEAEKFFNVHPRNVKMLSVGTTTSSYSLPHGIDKRMGVGAWMKKSRLIQTILSAQQQSSLQVVEHRLGPRYVRIDHSPSAEVSASLGLDRADKVAQNTLAGLAIKDVTDTLATPVLRQFLAHASKHWIIEESA